MEKLNFLETWSINQFKINHQVERIEIKKNEETDKYFFVYGLETGACSRKIQEGELTILVISKVSSKNTGKTFYLLHQHGECKGSTIATL